VRGALGQGRAGRGGGAGAQAGVQLVGTSSSGAVWGCADSLVRVIRAVGTSDGLSGGFYVGKLLCLVKLV
jgi:hypothetical protein